MYSLYPLVDAHDWLTFIMTSFVSIAIFLLLYLAVSTIFDEKPAALHFGTVTICCLWFMFESLMIGLCFKPLKIYTNEKVESEFLGWQPEVIGGSKSVEHTLYARFLVPEGETMIKIPEGLPVSKITTLYKN